MLQMVESIHEHNIFSGLECRTQQMVFQAFRSSPRRQRRSSPCVRPQECTATVLHYQGMRDHYRVLELCFIVSAELFSAWGKKLFPGLGSVSDISLMDRLHWRDIADDFALSWHI